jgi:hypothetical protein
MFAIVNLSGEMATLNTVVISFILVLFKKNTRHLTAERSIRFLQDLLLQTSRNMPTVGLHSGILRHATGMIYLLPAIGLSPGGSTHLHTNNTQNNTNNNYT